MNQLIPMQARDTLPDHDCNHHDVSHHQDNHANDMWAKAGGLLDQWYVACTSAELTADKALTVKIMGRGIAVFRDAAGNAAAIVDQCVHRASLLSEGQINNGCITCPYHGWSYNAQGQVAHIPSVDGIHWPSKPHPFKQKSFAVCEQDDVVWVFLGDADPSQTPVFKLPFYSRPDFVSYYMVGTYDGDVSAVAQNIMDVSHTVFVHDKVFRSTEGKPLESTIEVKPLSLEVLYDDNDGSVGFMPWLTNPHGAPQLHTDRFFAPNITQVDYHWGDASGMVFNSLITPIDEHSSRVYTCVSYKFPIPKIALKLMRPMVNVYTKFVNNQDMTIMNIRRRGIASAPVGHQHSVRADMAHIAIEKILNSIRERQPMAAHHLGKRPMCFEI